MLYRPISTKLPKVHQTKSMSCRTSGEAKKQTSLPAQTSAKEERADERRFFFAAKKEEDVLLLLETWQETVQKQVQPLQ
jgi:hypothetical protein